jgi:2-oxoglutarate ferredoxin oxidoreductase subunit alpha
VRLAVEGQKPISYLGRAGGMMPTVEEMIEAAKKALKEVK